MRKSSKVQNKFVYGRVTDTNLVQRNSENLEKKSIKGNKKEIEWSKRQNFKIGKMSMGENDIYKNKC